MGRMDSYGSPCLPKISGQRQTADGKVSFIIKYLIYKQEDENGRSIGKLRTGIY